MKNLSWFVLAILILSSINEPTKLNAVTSPNPLQGVIAFTIADLPQSEGIEKCVCVNEYIYSGDRQFKKPCPCKLNGGTCKCPKKPDDSGSLPDKAPVPTVSDDCDKLKTVKEMAPGYRQFKPRSNREMWVLHNPTVNGKNWCEPCLRMDKEFEAMEKTGWTIDKKGDLTTAGTFHIRLINFEEFEGFPSYFFEQKKDSQGRILMNHDGQPKEDLSLPTVVYWLDGKVKSVHFGFLNSHQMLDIFEGKPIRK